MSETLQQPQQNKGVIRISLVALLAGLYMAHKVLPIVGYYTPAVVRMGMFGLLLLLLVPMFGKKAAWAMFGFFGVSALSLLNSVVRGGGLLLDAYGELQTYLYGLIALWFVQKEDLKSCRNLFLFILAMYVLTAVTTIIGNNQYPQASRLMATLSSNDHWYKVYSRLNIGGFTFAYEFVLLTPLLIYLIHSRIIKPLLGYGMLILFGVAIFTMEYGLAVILFTASLLLLVIPKLTTKRLLVILLIIFVLFAFLGNTIADLFENASKNVDSETLSDRFLAVAETLRGEETVSSGSVQSRKDRYSKAWNLFVDSSFLGVWGTVSSGGHSFMLDTLAQYGILGLAAIICFLSSIYRFCLRPFRGRDFLPYILWACLAAVLLMVMNPKAYMFMFLCVLPLFGYGLMTDERRKKPHEITMDCE